MSRSWEPEEGEPERRPPLRPWQIALVYLAIAVILAALGLGGIWSDLSLLPQRPAGWWMLATAIPAAATVLLRRRAPWIGLALAVAVAVVDVLTVGGLVPLLAVLELLHAGILVLSPARRRIVLRGIVVVTIAGAVLAQLVTGDPRATILIGLQLGALLGMTYWYANSVAQSTELVALYRERAADLARLAALDRSAAVSAERDRVARELHDVVAGHVAAVAIRAEATLSSGDPAQPGPADDRAALRAVRDSSLAAHAALRDLIGVLRADAAEPPRPCPAPGRDRLPELVAEARRSGLEVEFADDGAVALETEADGALGQIVREALANAARHDAGATARVRVAASERAADGGEPRPGVGVMIATRGGRPLPHPELRGSGLGLRLLDERVRALGGDFAAGPDGGGWSVSAWLPAAGPRS
ncbi:histidine kinase [Leucobacter allii]|uniref:histidine kinase n=1 Tax=Leucobacter allii TaxID=2932247 RepID=A0ABY4FP47_9MICO|nr:sensor histidine kinase [Leucobacter allii]UOQ58011.1 histidine kinase [Leucobacter allii]